MRIGRRGFACSFCGRGEAQVAKLVAGPRVYICDRCTELAMQIVKAGSGEGPRPPQPAATIVRAVLRRLARRLLSSHWTRAEWRAGSY